MVWGGGGVQLWVVGFCSAFFFFLLKGLKRLNKGSVKKKKGRLEQVERLMFIVSFYGIFYEFFIGKRT